MDIKDMGVILDINDKTQELLEAQEEQIKVVGELLELLQAYADSLQGGTNGNVA